MITCSSYELQNMITMIKYPLYLVPFDFSEVSDNALNLSLDLARMNDGSVYLLHVVKSNPEKFKINHRFDVLVNKLSKDDRDLVTTNVIVGSIYEDVGRASVLLKPSLLVLGTHGAMGLQKVFGSHIEKMISNSPVPLLVTQGEKSLDKIKNIVLPFSFTKESLKITRFAASMAKKFDACVHLVAEHDNNSMHEDQIKRNKIIVKQYMAENFVSFLIVDLPREKSFEHEMISYAAKVDADIIAVSYSNNNALHTTNSFIQGIIENVLQIPVLTINAEELTRSYY